MQSLRLLPLLLLAIDIPLPGSSSRIPTASPPMTERATVPAAVSRNIGAALRTAEPQPEEWTSPAPPPPTVAAAAPPPKHRGQSVVATLLSVALVAVTVSLVAVTVKLSFKFSCCSRVKVVNCCPGLSHL